MRDAAESLGNGWSIPEPATDADCCVPLARSAATASAVVLYSFVVHLRLRIFFEHIIQPVGIDRLRSILQTCTSAQ